MPDCHPGPVPFCHPGPVPGGQHLGTCSLVRMVPVWGGRPPPTTKLEHLHNQKYAIDHLPGVGKMMFFAVVVLRNHDIGDYYGKNGCWRGQRCFSKM